MDVVILYIMAVDQTCSSCPSLRKVALQVGILDPAYSLGIALNWGLKRSGVRFPPEPDTTGKRLSFLPAEMPLATALYSTP